jgi:hypothetical protein
MLIKQGKAPALRNLSKRRNSDIVTLISMDWGCNAWPIKSVQAVKQICNLRSAQAVEQRHM